MSEATQITTLKNGLRVASETLPHVETAALGVWVNAGGRNEAAHINGAAHMLEHMAFKGTSSRSALDIALEIENVGGQLNAYTGREQTAYYARTLKHDWPLALDILADILQHSSFEAHELERERQVILQEIGQVNDTPDDLIFDRFQEIAYPYQACGRSILGTPDIVAGMQSDDLKAFMRQHYDPATMVVSAAGNVDHAALVDLCERSFADLQSHERPELAPSRYVPQSWIDERDFDQLHVILGVDGLSFRDDDFYALQTLSMILGGGMSSRLFQEVREQRGLAYSVFSFASSMSDGGLFGIYAGTGAEQTEELLTVIGQELKKLTHTIDATELERARNQIQASLMMGLESCSAVCEDMARQLLCFDRRLTNAEVIARFDAVTIDQLHNIAARLLTGAKPALAAIGPWPSNLAKADFVGLLAT